MSRRASANSSAAPSAGRASRNAPAILASSGNWCSTASQKAWMVWIFSPPGVSSAGRTAFARARELVGVGLRALRFARSAARARRRPASSSPAGRRRRGSTCWRRRRACRSGRGSSTGRCPRAAAGSRAASAHASCPSRHWPTPRPNCAGSEARACSRSVSVGDDTLPPHSPASPSGAVAAGRPFEHAREMVVVAVGLALAERERRATDSRLAGLS